MQESNNQILFKKILTQLNKINDYKNPIDFQRIPQKNKDLTLLTIGNVGTGKSTLNNWIMYKYITQYTNSEHGEQHYFKSQKSLQSVTKCVEQKNQDGISIIDTPGTNDADQNLRNDVISIQTIDFLKKKQIVQDKGLSGIVQCIMLNEALRIDHTTVKAMSRLLLSYTYLYPDFNQQKAPRLNVVFTNYSKYGHGQNIKSQSPFQKFQEDQDKDIKFDQLIKIYKLQLKQQLMEEYTSLDNNFISKRIDQVFQDCNFYAFKDGLSDNEKIKEQQQVQQLIDNNIDHGRWAACNLDRNAVFEPVWLDCESRDLITNQISKNIQFYEEELQRGQEDYQISTNKKSQQIEELIIQMKQINKEFKQILKGNPEVFMKLPAQELDEELKNNIVEFSKLCHKLFVQEMSKHSKELAEKFQKDQQKFQEQISIQEKKINNMTEENKKLQQGMKKLEEESIKKEKEFKQQMENLELEHQQYQKDFQEKLDQQSKQIQKDQQSMRNLEERMAREQEEFQREKRRLRQEAEEARSSSQNGLLELMMMSQMMQPHQMAQPQQIQPQMMDYQNIQPVDYSFKNSTPTQPQIKYNKTKMGRDKIHICPKCGKDYFYHGSYINHKNNCQ